MEEQNLQPEEEFFSSSGNDYFDDAVDVQLPYYFPRPRRRLPYFPYLFPILPFYPYYPYPDYPYYPYYPY
ncbi:hypothetical protein [Domibacillus epiphyticus]|uniref:hypothetical protein n=1 Tax=Domibacillus epiphyticus TaxID=1714355 RepID=UPI0018E92FC2|nr:hypothetical protein [Domibacillus epiphyticus]